MLSIAILSFCDQSSIVSSYITIGDDMHYNYIYRIMMIDNGELLQPKYDAFCSLYDNWSEWN